MNAISSCVHALEGRLRIKVPEVKGAPLKATEVERHLAQSPGVEEVSANPITGSVLVLYNPCLIGQEEIVFAFQEIGYLQDSKPKVAGGSHAASSSGGNVFGTITSAVASSLMEVALSRLVAAII